MKNKNAIREKQKNSGGALVGLYCAIIVFAVTAGFVYGARTSGLFACQAPDTSSDRYLGICNVTKYGDYDHGAFWFGLEPQAVEAAVQARVLFVGNSRMQFGLSTSEVDNWFAEQALPYYLLGFSHDENHLFLAPLLQELQPRAAMVVISIDRFFEEKLTGPADSVMNKPESGNRYKQKYYWQLIHERICGASNSLCGYRNSYIRQRGNGSWTFEGADFLARIDFTDRPITYDHNVDNETLVNYTDRAQEFLQTAIPQANCVVLMNIPNSETSAGTATAIAQQLGLPLIAPQMDGLLTFDGSHLDPQSAARWSSAFIQELAPHVKQCFAGVAE